MVVETDFGFDKVMAVSTTGFAPGAVAYAQEAGIELRTMTDLPPDVVATWFLPQDFNTFYRTAELEHLRVLIAESEPVERYDAVARVLATGDVEKVVFFSAQKGDRIQPRVLFTALVHQNQHLWPDPPLEGWSRRVNIDATFPPGNEYLIETDLGGVMVPRAIFTGSLRVTKRSTPVSRIGYMDVLTDRSIVQSVSANADVDGHVLTIKFDRMPDETTRVVLQARRKE